jgi:Mg/Co/Ni transporter MgtE
MKPPGRFDSDPFVGIGCGLAAGAVLGILLAVRITFYWVRPGVWYEWPVVGAIVVASAATTALVLKRVGRPLWAWLVVLMRWCG